MTNSLIRHFDQLQRDARIAFMRGEMDENRLLNFYGISKEEIKCMSLKRDSNLKVRFCKAAHIQKWEVYIAGLWDVNGGHLGFFETKEEARNFISQKTGKKF